MCLHKTKKATASRAQSLNAEKRIVVTQTTFAAKELTNLRTIINLKQMIIKMKSIGDPLKQ